MMLLWCVRVPLRSFFHLTLQVQCDVAGRCVEIAQDIGWRDIDAPESLLINVSVSGARNTIYRSDTDTYRLCCPSGSRIGCTFILTENILTAAPATPWRWNVEPTIFNTFIVWGAGLVTANSFNVIERSAMELKPRPHSL
jgi:hypothetical protein